MCPILVQYFQISSGGRGVDIGGEPSCRGSVLWNDCKGTPAVSKNVQNICFIIMHLIDSLPSSSAISKLGVDNK